MNQPIEIIQKTLEHLDDVIEHYVTAVEGFQESSNQAKESLSRGCDSPSDADYLVKAYKLSERHRLEKASALVALEDVKRHMIGLLEEKVHFPIDLG